MIARVLLWPYHLAVTMALWGYFTVGFVVFFSPLYFAAAFCRSRRRMSFAKITHWFFRIFFLLLRVLIPWLRIQLPPELREARSCVIVCNHVSFLDPLLMIAANPRQCTMVKASFFRIPIFGWMLKLIGYIPAETMQNSISPDTLTGIEQLRGHFSAGGNLFLFPEGSRSRTGELGTFRKGAFQLARYYQLPIAFLRVERSNELFPPGRLLFRSMISGPIALRWLGRLEPDYLSPDFSILKLTQQAFEMINSSPSNS